MAIGTTIILNDGNKIPLLGFGTWKLTQGPICEQAVLNALKAGYRHIDTASFYGNEKSIGDAIKKSGMKRKDIFITTKLWNDQHGDPEGALEESLKKLQTDYADLYLMHYPLERVRNRTWMAMEKLKDIGLARSVGVSNFTIAHLTELIEKTKFVPAVNQVEFSPFLFQKDLLAYCKKHKIALEAYAPLTRGSRLGDKTVAEIAKKHKKTPAQVLIRWCLERSIVVIPKAQSDAHILENADVFGFKLTETDMKKLDSLSENYRMCWNPEQTK